MENFKIGFRKKSNKKENDDILTRNSTLITSEGENLNIEEYLYLELEKGEMIVKKDFLKKYNEHVNPEHTISEMDLWRIAERNTENDYVLSNLGEILGFNSDNGLMVLSNKKRILGASALLSFQARKEICEKLGTKRFLVLPSSIHEVLIVSQIDRSINEFNDMVKFVNENEVDPEERLEDKAFIVELYRKHPVI